MRGKKPKQPTSLWEVVNKDRLKQSQDKVKDEVVHSQQTRPEVKQPSQSTPVSSPVFRKSRKFGFQINRRIVVIAALVLIIVISIILKSGKDTVGEIESVSVAGNQVAQEMDVIPDKKADLPPFMEDEEAVEIKEQPVETALKSSKDNVIVITSYNVSKDLEPVKRYFEQKNVQTRIYKPESSIFYLLITKKKYDSPKKKGSDGYFQLENIKRIGAGYKAPKGYESFGRKPFQDAYGMKLKK